MRRAAAGLRGRVTFTVLAVSSVLFSILGTSGFLLITHGGRDAIRERIGVVLDQLEAEVRAGRGTVNLNTADGVSATVHSRVDQLAPPTRSVIRVERDVVVRGAPLRLVGESSQARLTDSLRSLYRGLWLAIPLAAIATAVMAGIATGRALRPVGAITDLASTIGASRAGNRVPVPDTGDEIEHLARTMNAMLDRIEVAATRQRQFTSDAAHELRTPLMALQGELELVGGRPDRVDSTLLERLVALSARLGERIDDLVLLSTLDEGRPLRLEPVDVLDLVRAEASPLPAITVIGDGAVVSADRSLVARAVRNLLANASRHAVGAVRVSVVAGDGRVSVDVDDDGPGIDPNIDVFARFTRLDEARSTDSGGSGLGLAIVASVAAAHGGGVALERSALGGARVSIWFPATASVAEATL